MALKALIFDCDGTLADTEEAHRTAFNRAFGKAGLDWHWSIERYRDLLGTTGGRERIARFIAEDTKPGADIVALHAAKNRIYADLVGKGYVGLRVGILPLIQDAIHNGIKVAIATTTSRSNLDALIAATALRDIDFAAIVCGEDVSHKKPDPEAYHVALDRLALDAGCCVAFEDSVNGLQAARAAGLMTIVTPNAYTTGADFRGAAIVFDPLPDDPREILGQLAALIEKPMSVARG